MSKFIVTLEYPIIEKFHASYFLPVAKSGCLELFFLDDLSVNAWCQLKEGRGIIDSQNLHTHMILQAFTLFKQ